MIKVLIVDDSPLLRAVLKAVLEQAGDIQVVGAAKDPYEARDMIKVTQPDVLTLDIEMPKMNGLSFLKNLMRLRPMPVVMLSTLTQKGSPETLEALEVGAVDFIAKPMTNVAEQLEAYADILYQKIRTASRARVRAFKPAKENAEKAASGDTKYKSNNIIAIGASTGGTEALREVLTKMPSNCPPVVITQHIPPVFSASFAQRMDRCCSVSVKEAEDGDVLGEGRVFIAPGDKHLLVAQQGGKLVCQLNDGDKVNRHKPAVDVLFDSLLPVAKQVHAALLTGMGSDGAQGLLRLKEGGANTFAQDEASCVVWGMPRAAVELNAANKVVSLDNMAINLLKSASR
ncbi:chemotaxis response regulator protein-glutamate methylesterase [Pseudoalteromonas luteoviolacea]|uniref:Protein-glutamate methylesterase/protein-glutamine glutaminase n=1 Tax=Pseudoalteromonas luteoviolacea TaxID=43657 RepID=A0A1C0TLG4_9GAMM|nr:chemotaxis response regulator protein-glutamate methylesterase [Pseudoalteromonas luteoviolacea]MBQ4813783.1 chemotaxis response regulator protein-glutamate methylesterase [Pseudoalteromonas luteoviolacea]OCQ19618.1 chemotaxis response regulator protein-glutamate methylesterase [Pseudoalteromonas luteoviolacea]